MKDKNGVELSVGDKFFWFNPRYTGVIVAINPRSNEAGVLSIKVNWDHHNEDPTWHEPERMIKLSEETIKEFLETVDKTDRVGRKFCQKFGFQDRTLSDQRCPGKAVQRIIEHYACRL